MIAQGVVRMVSFSMKARVKPDGSLQVTIPTGLPESDVDVLVVVRRVRAAREEGPAIDSWPEGFFERTFGCLAEDPLLREPQLQQEAREKLL
jgi:hypothetical protein